VGDFPPYWWLRRARRRAPDKLVNYGHCTVCRSMWFVSEAWDVDEAVTKARHRPWCLVKLSRAGATGAHTKPGVGGVLTGSGRR
jgi:hypothetical protein